MKRRAYAQPHRGENETTGRWPAAQNKRDEDRDEDIEEDRDEDREEAEKRTGIMIKG